MRIATLLLLVLTITIACTEKKSDKNFVLTGNIEGLKKGTLYIQRIQDTVLVAMDTIVISGDSHFKSEFDLKEPEMLYLFVDRGVSNSLDNNIAFFAEPGAMDIQTTLDFFTADATVTGSKNHALYEDFKKVVTRFVDTNLELIARKVKAQKNNRLDSIPIIEQLQENNIKRRYLYTTNFAVNNRDFEVAPYVTLAEIYDINLKYLDTICKSMSPRVKKTMYGQKLMQYYQERQQTGR